MPVIFPAEVGWLPSPLSKSHSAMLLLSPDAEITGMCTVLQKVEVRCWLVLPDVAGIRKKENLRWRYYLARLSTFLPV